jgi:hypothetical protein
MFHCIINYRFLTKRVEKFESFLVGESQDHHLLFHCPCCHHSFFSIGVLSQQFFSFITASTIMPSHLETIKSFNIKGHRFQPVRRFKVHSDLPSCSVRPLILVLSKALSRAMAVPRLSCRKAG